LTLHILAAVAEHERAMISERTMAALKAAKARGARLGGPNIAAARAKAAVVRTENARQKAENLRPIIDQIMRSGAVSLRSIASALTARGVNAIGLLCNQERSQIPVAGC